MITKTSGTPAPKRVAIVGNAPGMADQSGRIDGADWVVRFNNAAGLEGPAGRRTTHLALVNHGGQMGEWLADPGFTDRPEVREAGTILFPFPEKAEPTSKQDADGRDWTAEATTRLRPLGAGVEILPDRVHREAEAIVQTAERPGAVPSTGFLVALHLLAALPPETRIALHGFGFAGWDGHYWAGERRHLEALQATGRLDLHPLDASLPA